MNSKAQSQVKSQVKQNINNNNGSNNSNNNIILYYRKQIQQNKLNQIQIINYQDQDNYYNKKRYTLNQLYTSQYLMGLKTILDDRLIDGDLDDVTNMNNIILIDNNNKKMEKQQYTHYQNNYHNNNTKQNNIIKTNNNNNPNNTNKTNNPIPISTKYPIPLAFAYYQLYLNSKQHHNALYILKHQLQQKTNIINYHIINYNISLLQRRVNSITNQINNQNNNLNNTLNNQQQLYNINTNIMENNNNSKKKSMFYLQLVLKQKPFFQYAIYDYVRILETKKYGRMQGLALVKRHLLPVGTNNNFSNNINCYNTNNINNNIINTSINSTLTNSKYLQSLYIHLINKNHHFNFNFNHYSNIHTNNNNQTINNPEFNQLIRIFNNKSLNIIVYYNLALYFKKIKYYQKAQNMFREIIEKVRKVLKDKAEGMKKEGEYERKGKEDEGINDGFKLNEVNQRVYFMSRIHIIQIYQHLIKLQKQHQQQPQCQQQQQQHLKPQNTNILNNHLLKTKIISQLNWFKQNQLQFKHSTPIFYKKYSNNLLNYLNQKQHQLRIQKQIKQKQLKQKQYKQKLQQQQLADKNNGQIFLPIKRLKTESQADQGKQHVNIQQIINIMTMRNCLKRGNINMNNLNGANKLNPIVKKGHKKNFSSDVNTSKSYQLIKQFNRKFQQQRRQNQKKMKFLLLKDKQLDQFFNQNFNINKNINGASNNGKKLNKLQNISPNTNNNNKSIKNLPNNKSQQQQQQQQKTLLPHHLNIKSQIQTVKSSLIQKLKKQLKQNNNVLNKYQIEYQSKKIKYQKEFEGYNLDKALENIMNKIQNHDKQGNKQIQINNHNNNNNNHNNNNNNVKKFKITSKSHNNNVKFNNENKNITNNGNNKNNKSNNNNKKLQQSISSRLKQIKQNKQQNIQKQRGLQENNLSSFDRNNNNFTNKNTSCNNNSNLPQAHHQITSRNISFQINQKQKQSQHVQSQQPPAIFIKKQSNNNIQDIFSTFQNNGNNNIYNSRKKAIFISSKNLSKKKINLNENNFLGQITSINNLINQKLTKQDQTDKKIHEYFYKKYNQAVEYQMKGDLQMAYNMYIELYKKFKSQNMKEIILLAIAQNLERSKKYTEAQKTYEKCLKYNNFQAFMKLGLLQIKLGNIHMGIQSLQKANCIKRFDKQIETKLVYAYSLTQQTTKKALSLANNILQRDPLSIDVLIIVAKILENQGKVKQALEICLAIDNHKQSEFIKHYIGLLYLSDCNVIQAFKFFKSALNLNAQHVPSLIQVATILSQLKPKQAIIIFNKAIQLQPDNRLALTRLAKIYQSIQRNHQKAVQIYRKTLQTKQNYQAYIKIGDCQIKNECYLQAYLNYKQALKLNKTYQVYRKIAQIYQHNKQYRKAIQSYQDSINLIPQEYKYFQQKKQIILALSKILLIMLQFQKVITYLQGLLEKQISTQIYVLLGQGYFGKGQYDIALEHFKQAHNLDYQENQQENIQILELIALCFDKKQQYLASKSIYQKILQITPNNIKCMNNYANILLILGNINESFFWFQKIISKQPQNIEKRLKLSQIYFMLGDWSKVQYHLLACYKRKENQPKVLEKLIQLYKQKRQSKLVAKFQKKMAIIKTHKKGGIN